MKKVIITGANGFVGSYLSRCFAESGYEVTAVVRNENSDISAINNIENIKIVYCELDNINKLSEILGKEDYELFLHFAWEASAGQGRCDSTLQLHNVQAACNAVITAKQLGCRRFVFAGSIMAYEAQEYILKDGAEPSLSYIYSTAKLTASMMAKVTAIEQKIEYIDVIISNIYGIGEKSMRFLNSTIRSVINKTDLNLTSCEQIYDFIYVTDATEEIKIVSLNGENLSSYYIGNIEQYPLKKFILDIKNTLNPDINVNFGAVEFKGHYFEYQDIIDIGKTFEFGFRPKIDFKSGIKMLADNIIKEKKSYD